MMMTTGVLQETDRRRLVFEQLGFQFFQIVKLYVVAQALVEMASKTKHDILNMAFSPER